MRAGLLIVAAFSSSVLAGPLTPPPGPVAPTPGPESRIAINSTNTPGDADSLFRINAPGSYYLTGNITGVVGKHGIEIQASAFNSGITIDLNGFTMEGVSGMGAFDGITMAAVATDAISIRNGSILRWGRDGIRLPSITDAGRIEGITAHGNTGVGINVGIGHTLSDCTATDNGGSGIEVGFGSTLINCAGRGNTGNGIATSAGGGCTLFNCAGASNGGAGIVAGSTCSLTNCSTYSNDLDGILTGSSCSLAHCTAQVNGANGITAGVSNLVIACSTYSNTGNGISTASGCTVADCVTRGNILDGIVLTSDCIVRGNTCASNGSSTGDGAGIHATSSDNRIEGNNCTSADRGIDVDSAGNIIIRNTCASNTIDWTIAANNVVGPILDRRAPASVAISGFSAPSSLGSTDANANYSY